MRLPAWMRLRRTAFSLMMRSSARRSRCAAPVHEAREVGGAPHRFEGGAPRELVLQGHEVEGWLRSEAAMASKISRCPSR